MEWIVENQATIWTLVGLLLGVATIVVRWTKTPKDDAILERIKQVLNVLKPADKKEGDKGAN